VVVVQLIDSVSRRRLAHAVSGGLAVPRLVKVGFGTIVFGLVFDLSEHSFALPARQAAGGFSLGEHAAHLVVLVGMVIVLAGVIADGIRSAGRSNRQKWSPSDALR
jgi:hypothetical protein